MPYSLIAIVDDDEAVRLSTCSLLKQRGFKVTPFESGDAFLAGKTPDSFACILLDMRMPGSDGLAVLLALRDRGASSPVIVITGHGEISEAVQAMNLGAQDFIEKPYEPAGLLAAIELALTSRLRTREAMALSTGAKALVGGLSQRQRQVLQGIVRGQPSKLIAYELGISIRTVEAYRAQLLAKLGVRGTTEAVRLAIAAGLHLAVSLLLTVLSSFGAAGREIFGGQPLGADLEQIIALTMA